MHFIRSIGTFIGQPTNAEYSVRLLLVFIALQQRYLLLSVVGAIGVIL